MSRDAFKRRSAAKQEQAEGRRFKTKPDAAFVDRFRKHILKRGTPVGFPGLCWTKPAADDARQPLTKFATPETLRSRVPMARCPICSPDSPKYYEGLLCWSPRDKRVRAIGHECGHDFYDGDSFALELDEFAEAAKEAAARTYIEEFYPRLPEFVLRARWIVQEFDALCDARDELVATITKKAIGAALRSRGPGGELTVEFASSLRDGQGRLLLNRQAVTGPVAMEGFKVVRKARADLAEGTKWAGNALVLRREPHPMWRDEPSQRETLDAADRAAILDLERRCREFKRLVEKVSDEVVALRACLRNASLNELSRWGTHLHAPSPFWINATANGVTAGRGPHVRSSGRRIRGLPPADV